jgi:dTDP-4-dehydrorhamnose reductase
LKVLVTGSQGMVGRALVEHLKEEGDQVFAHDHASLEIADAEAVFQTFERERPDVVINCAAWTDVDGCEADEARAFDANARGPENLARACRQIEASLVTISTDYVFDGEKDGFYTQRDDPHPTGVYASSKLEGERLAQAACARTIVVRTGWLFGPGGRNFLSTVIERARRSERLSAIGDAYGTPTFVVDLATRLRELAVRDLPGLYHVVNSGDGASYAEFARVALKLVKLEASALETVSMNTLKRPAPRPRNSRLRCLLSEAIGLEPLAHWEDALRRFAAPRVSTEMKA